MLSFKQARVGAIAVATSTLIAGQAAAQDVEFMTWSYTEDANRAKIEALIESFTSATDLSVEPQGYAWGEMGRNLFLRARSRTLPDVSQVQGRLLPSFAGIDGLVDLNEVIGRDALEAMFDPGFLAAGEVDGRQVALPWIGGTIGLVANGAVLEAAGVDEIPTTLEEFRAALIAVRDSVEGSVPFGMATTNNNSIVLDYLVMVWAHGGDVLVDGAPTVNSPEAVAALAFMTDLVADRLAAPEIDRPDARRLFGQGAVAFYLDAPQARTFARQFSGQGEAYDEFVLPVLFPVAEEGVTPPSIQWGHVLAVFGDDDMSVDDPAIQFVMHLLSDDVLVGYTSQSGVLPTTQSGLASDAVQSDAYLSAWAAASMSPRRNVIASLSNGSEIATIIGEEVQSALLGQKSPQEAADDMQTRIADALENAD